MLQLPVLRLPKAVPIQRERKPQDNIPPTRAEREGLRSRLREFVAQRKPVPPLWFEELQQLAREYCRTEGVPSDVRRLTSAFFSTARCGATRWRPFLSSVGCLLLPKCLREEEHCPASFDEFGLLCKQCGLCSIQDLQEEAERLGYAVLVAEGSALVTAMIATGKVEAIVGVSCLSVLEKAFPYMESAAIPGVAIPLLQDDCRDVTVDLEWIWEVVHLTSADRTYRMNLDGAAQGGADLVRAGRSLKKSWAVRPTRPRALAHQWLAKEGKRWRPFLAVCVWKSLQEDPLAPLPVRSATHRHRCRMLPQSVPHS